MAKNINSVEWEIALCDNTVEAQIMLTGFSCKAMAL